MIDLFLTGDVAIITMAVLLVLGLLVLVLVIIDRIGLRSSKNFNELVKGIKDANTQLYLDSGANNMTILEIINKENKIKYDVKRHIGLDIDGLMPLELLMASMRAFCHDVKIVYSTNVAVDIDRPGELMYNDAYEGNTIHIIRADKSDGSLYFAVSTWQESTEWVGKHYQISDAALRLYSRDGHLTRVGKLVYYEGVYAQAKARELERIVRRTFPVIVRERKPFARLYRLYKGPFSIDASQYEIDEIPKTKIDLDTMYGTLTVKTGRKAFDVPASGFLELFLGQSLKAIDHITKEGKEVKAAEGKINCHIKGPVGTGKTRFIGDLIHHICESNKDAKVFSVNAKELTNLLRNSKEFIDYLSSHRQENIPMFLIVDESDRFFDTPTKTDEQSVLLEIMDGGLTYKIPINVIVVSNLNKMAPYFERRFDMTMHFGETPAERIDQICAAYRDTEFIDEKELKFVKDSGLNLPLSQVFNDIIIPPRILAMRSREKKIAALLENMEKKKVTNTEKATKPPTTEEKVEKPTSATGKTKTRSRGRTRKRSR